MFEASLPGKSRWGLRMYRQGFFPWGGVGHILLKYQLIESYAKAEKTLICMVLRWVRPKDRQERQGRQDRQDRQDRGDRQDRQSLKARQDITHIFAGGVLKDLQNRYDCHWVHPVHCIFLVNKKISFITFIFSKKLWSGTLYYIVCIWYLIDSKWFLF